MARTETLQLRVDRVATPIGVLLLLQDGDGRLRALDWQEHEERMQRLLRLHYGAGGVALERGDGTSEIAARLRRYFAGEIAAIDDVPVETGGTPFQRSVWRALRAIASGTTISYGELACRIGKPSAARAVGLANGSNPIGIVLPCHRVIGADASLTGYGGGIERKRWLLAHEGAVVGRAAASAAGAFRAASGQQRDLLP